MAQGNTKGMKAKTPSGGRKKGGTMPKGKRDIAPKKRDHVRERATKKVSELERAASRRPSRRRAASWREPATATQ